MLERDKAMIAGCVDRLNQQSCAGCVRRDPCHAMLSMFRLGPNAVEGEPARNPLLALLGSVAQAIQRSGQRRTGVLQRDIERLVEPLLAARPIRIDDVARQLHFSRQTLYRRLKAEGVTFEQVLDRLKSRLALRALKQGRSVKDTAYALGFSDPAAFSRAFKRWTGKSPRDVLRRLH